MVINSLWISGELTKHQLLTVRSFIDHGHSFKLWTYEDIQIDGVEVRDAREILPESEIFYYKHLEPSFKFGGIAERLKAELLYAVGGWHVDMDVTCLKPFDFKADYVFAPHKLGMVGNIIKAPAKSKFAEYYLKWTKTINEHNTNFERSIEGLYAAAVFLNLTDHIQPPTVFGRDENDYVLPLLKQTTLSPDSRRYAIHWMGAMGHVKNYEPNSFYDSLLKKYSL